MGIEETPPHGVYFLGVKSKSWIESKLDISLWTHQDRLHTKYFYSICQMQMYSIL